MNQQIVYLCIASMFALSVCSLAYLDRSKVRWCGRFSLLMLVLMAVPSTIPIKLENSRLNSAQQLVLKELMNRIANNGKN